MSFSSPFRNWSGFVGARAAWPLHDRFFFSQFFCVHPLHFVSQATIWIKQSYRCNNLNFLGDQACRNAFCRKFRGKTAKIFEGAQPIENRRQKTWSQYWRMLMGAGTTTESSPLEYALRLVDRVATLPSTISASKILRMADFEVHIYDTGAVNVQSAEYSLSISRDWNNDRMAGYRQSYPRLTGNNLSCWMLPRKHRF